MNTYKSDERNWFFDSDRNARFFIKIFKSKKHLKHRPGALPPDEVRKLVEKIGSNKKVNIRRVEYDGTPEESPITVQILDIRNEYFTGRVVNVERSIKQDMDNRLIYLKGGGGTIDFKYKDGDIMSIEEDLDELIIDEKKNVDELLQILDALDLNESILISYYDREKSGVINGMGKLISKDVEHKNFKVELTLINDIELDKVKVVSLDLETDSVLDLEVVI
ncbi:MAG: hypothetical protein AB7T22_01835 [Calditrichaceae bacterium]